MTRCGPGSSGTYPISRCKSSGAAPRLPSPSTTSAAPPRTWSLNGLLGGVSAGTPLGDDLPPAARLDGQTGDRDAAQPVTVFHPVAEGSHPCVAARRAGVLPSTLVHAAWALLLARWSGSEDVVFGTSVSGRPGELDGAEQRIGMVLNTVVLRIPVPGHACLGRVLPDV